LQVIPGLIVLRRFLVVCQLLSSSLDGLFQLTLTVNPLDEDLCMRSLLRFIPFVLQTVQLCVNVEVFLLQEL
jgi:hypothetical protein